MMPSMTCEDLGEARYASTIPEVPELDWFDPAGGYRSAEFTREQYLEEQLPLESETAWQGDCVMQPPTLDQRPLLGEAGPSFDRPTALGENPYEYVRVNDLPIGRT